MHDRSWYHLASRVCGSHPGRTDHGQNGGLALRQGNAGVFEAASIRERCSHDVTDAEGRRLDELESVYIDNVTDLRRPAGSGPECRPSTGSCSCFLTTRLWVPGCFKVSYDKKQVKDAPSLSTDGELPGAGGEWRPARS